LTPQVILTEEEDPTVSEAPATGVPPADTVSLMVRMLHEAFAGPAGPWTYFTDAAPGTGAFATIGGVSAVEASLPGGPAMTTIAGHVHHLRSSLALSTRALGGEETSRDRSRSWTISTVDESGWVHLQAGLHRAYESFRVAVETRSAWDEDALGVAFGAVAHAAYHLGAIRQRLPRRPPGG
jgi:hypothetical protein